MKLTLDELLVLLLEIKAEHPGSGDWPTSWSEVVYDYQFSGRGFIFLER